MDVSIPVLALVTMVAAIIAKTVTIGLLRNMRLAISMVAQERRHALSRLKVAQSQRKVAERNRASLQRKKAKLQKRIAALKREMGSQVAEQRQRQAVVKTKRKKLSRAA